MRATGVVLVGGASRRFGSPKHLAVYGGSTLAERAWRLLGDAFPHRLAVGKAREAGSLPFAVVDDGTSVRAPLAGLVAGLRAAATDVVVFIPVDMPLLTVDALHALADVCLDAAVPPTGPLPAAYRQSALATLERHLRAGQLRIRDALVELDVGVVELTPQLLANVNEPADLARIRAAS